MIRNVHLAYPDHKWSYTGDQIFPLISTNCHLFIYLFAAGPQAETGNVVAGKRIGTGGRRARQD